MKALVVELNLAKAALALLLKRFSNRVFYSPLSILKYYPDYPEPKLPAEDWVKIETSLCGICGSDIRVITLEESFYLFPLTSFPFIPGHEVVGTIEKVGSSVKNFSEGERVVINPALPCRVRGFEECDACKKGHYAVCYNTDRGKISPGLFTGFCKDTGGGWAESLIAHETQLVRVNGIKDENAIFAEPITIGLHAVLRNFPKDDEIVAVVGCGIIGLLTIAVLRYLGFRGEIVGIDTNERQAGLAMRFGASKTITKKPIAEIAEMTGGRVYRPPREKEMIVGGGVDVVYECVGSAGSIETALRIAKPLGNVVIAGTAAKIKVDWAPIFAKELNLIGTFGCGVEEVGGERKSTFELAVEILRKRDFSELLTHRFRLEEYKKALWAVLNKNESKAAKVAFNLKS